jgi:hypothetical protein
MSPNVEHEALDLVEERRVRGVEVDPEHAARRDEAERRRPPGHGADLHR